MRLHKAVHDGSGNVGVSETGVDDALSPDFHHGFNHLPVLAERRVVDVHAGEVLQILDVKLTIGRVALDGKIDEIGNVVLHVPHEPRIRAPESRHVGGIGLGDVEGGRNLVVHRHHDALAPVLTAGCQRNSMTILSGTLALIAVAGRMAATRTTDLSPLTTRLRKYAISSSVSVPCVTTMPSMSSFASSSLIRLASVSRFSMLSFELPTLKTCSPVIYVHNFSMYKNLVP